MIALFMSTALLLGTPGSRWPRPPPPRRLRRKRLKRKTTETKPATCLEKAGSDQAPKGRLREEVRRYIQDGKSGDPEEEGGEVVARRR
jgi:hypothetical protein